MEFFLVLLNALPPEAWAAIVGVIVAVGSALKAALTFVGACTALVAALKLLVPPLQRLADRTSSKVDNAWVTGFGALLDVVAGFLDAARKHLELWAGNRFLSEEVVRKARK